MTTSEILASGGLIDITNNTGSTSTISAIDPPMFTGQRLYLVGGGANPTELVAVTNLIHLKSTPINIRANLTTLVAVNGSWRHMA